MIPGGDAGDDEGGGRRRRPNVGWPMRVVADGLRWLRELRFLDVQINNWCDEREKIRWCRDLQDMLRVEGQGEENQKVRVLCVEQVRPVCFASGPTG